MMEEELGTPGDSSATQIIECHGQYRPGGTRNSCCNPRDWWGGGRSKQYWGREVPHDGGYEEQEVVEEEHEEDEKMDEAQPFTRPTIIALLPILPSRLVRLHLHLQYLLHLATSLISIQESQPSSTPHGDSSFESVEHWYPSFLRGSTTPIRDENFL